MSNRYKGGIISATPPTTTGGESGTASGAWTLEQQMQAQAAGLWPLQPTGPYIEDVFSTWLYTGNGSTQTINNGIDLAGKGGMVWGKTRDAVVSHTITDTVRGVDKELFTNTTDAQVTRAAGTGSVYAFNSNGFSTSATNGFINYSGLLAATWAFRKQPKFFDVVTYTGNGTTQNIAHSLGSVPGCIIVKRTSSTRDWGVYHRSLANTQVLYLNATSAASADPGAWNSTTPTSTQFTVGNGGISNTSGQTYVAYLFAHDAGGFGLSGTDNVISCGSYTGNGSFPNGPIIDVGFQPQWVMVKRATGGTGKWLMLDTMRGWTANSGNQQGLWANTSEAEAQNASGLELQTRGWQLRDTDPEINGNGSTYIYIAIRRGPMRTPTTGTSVFAPVTATGTGSIVNITTGFPVDLVIDSNRTGSVNSYFMDRLRGGSQYTFSQSAAAESSFSNVAFFDRMTSYGNNNWGASVGSSIIDWCLRRAPSFFDEVCYTGTGTTGQTYAHNLGVVPEMMIVKSRTVGSAWYVYTPTTGNTNTLVLNSTAAVAVRNVWGDTTPTASVFSVGTSGAGTNNSGATYVAYLFASCPGVSKVGSYTGTGTTQTINCGFTGGARFVLIKRTDSTGDWFVWDTARGMIPANDPYLLLNSTAAEVTGTDFVDTAATGFEITSTAPAAINASGGTFIFLAIA
jgi:hypothetical protein